MCKEYIYPNTWRGMPGSCVFTVVDAETTGLDPKKDEIIEIGCVKIHVNIKEWKQLDQINYLREPDKMPLSEKITKITGITNAEIADKIICDRKKQEIRDLFGTSKFVVAHNAAFDRPFVEGLVGKQDIPWMDSLTDIPWKDLGYTHASLEYIALKNGWNFKGHRAWNDAHMTAFLLSIKQEQGNYSCGLGYLLEKVKVGETYSVQAYRAPFAKKDTLKGRGYKWNPSMKVWWKPVCSREKGESELKWIRGNIGGNPELLGKKLTERFRL